MDRDAALPPDGLGREAHVTGSGELLWPRRAAVEAAKRLAARSVAIRGGEVYLPKGPFSAVMVNEWRTEPDRGPAEEWSGYVGRGLAAALDAIERYPGPPSERDGRPLFFLATGTLEESDG